MMPKRLPKPSEAKSKVAQTRERVNGKFVSKDGRKKNNINKLEEDYQITEEDRLKFGSDSKAFFEWALTKAATRYEAAKYAKELMRFQYPTLQSAEAEDNDIVTEKVFRWENASPSENSFNEAIIMEDSDVKERTKETKTSREINPQVEIEEDA